jgi:hypothetical protein
MAQHQEAKQEPKATAAAKEDRKPKLRIVKLEERIAPKLATNHNETLVSGPVKAKLQIVKLEERIAPRITQNHNETFVGDRPAKAR